MKRTDIVINNIFYYQWISRLFSSFSQSNLIRRFNAHRSWAAGHGRRLSREQFVSSKERGGAVVFIDDWQERGRATSLHWKVKDLALWIGRTLEFSEMKGMIHWVVFVICKLVMCKHRWMASTSNKLWEFVDECEPQDYIFKHCTDIKHWWQNFDSNRTVSW